MRATALADLDLIRPHAPLEAAQIDRARRWMRSGAVLARRVKPACPPQHLVACFPHRTDPHLARFVAKLRAAPG